MRCAWVDCSADSRPGTGRPRCLPDAELYVGFISSAQSNAHDRSFAADATDPRSTAKPKPIARGNIAFCQPRRLLQHPPQPFHPDATAIGGGAPNQAQLDLDRLAHAEGPAGRQDRTMRVDEHLAACGAPDPHDQHRGAECSDSFGKALAVARSSRSNPKAGTVTSQIDAIANRPFANGPLGLRAVHHEKQPLGLRIRRHAHQLGGDFAAGDPVDRKAAACAHSAAPATRRRRCALHCGRRGPSPGSDGSLQCDRCSASPPERRHQVAVRIAATAISRADSVLRRKPKG